MSLDCNKAGVLTAFSAGSLCASLPGPMGNEIERKFLINQQLLPVPDSTESFEQGYLLEDLASVRLRIRGENCYLTIKSCEPGLSRKEFEYSIPMSDGLEMLSSLCGQSVRKKRHFFRRGDQVWEVDEFEGKNAGLWLAELELKEENEAFEPPDWVEAEVTGQEKYSNAYLARHPFQDWS